MSSLHNTLKIHINSILLLLAESTETRSCNTHYNDKKAKLPKPALMLWAGLSSNSSQVNRRETKVLPVLACPVGPLREIEEHNQVY